MKRLLPLLFALLPLVSYAQTLPKNEQGQYAFSQVTPVEGLQTALYQKAKAWVATEYKSAKDVLQVDTPEQLIGNGISTLRDNVKLHYTLSIQLKDGRYKVDFTNLVYSIGQANSSAEELLTNKNSYKGNGELRALPKQMVEDTHTEVTRLQASLLKALQAGSSEW